MATLYYLPTLIDKTQCLGNTLSTINIALSTLDNVLFDLSTYTSTNISLLSGDIDALTTATNIASTQLYTAIYTASTTLYTDLYTQVHDSSATLTSFIVANSSSIAALSAQTTFLTNSFQIASTLVPSFTQNTIYQLPNGVINYDPTVSGPNVKVQLSANGFLANPTNLLNGHFGKIVLLSSPTTGLSLTGYGSQWSFSNFLSGMSVGLNARNMIDYYFDASPTPKVLATMNRY